MNKCQLVKSSITVYVQQNTSTTININVFKLNQDLVFNVVIPYDFTELIWWEVHTEMFT